MIRIKIYDVEHGQTDTGFYLEVPIIPRAGEYIHIHQSLCGEDFVKVNPDEFAFAAEIETSASAGIGTFVVISVTHFYAKHFMEIEVGVTCC